MNKYQTFIFKDYAFDQSKKTLELSYALDDALVFTEVYKFDFEFAGYDNDVLDRALQGLFFMAGVSYYKTYLPPKIVIEKGELDANQAKFFAKTYQKGLGEFFYRNNLDPNQQINFPADSSVIVPLKRNSNSGQLVGIGGGKDSLVSVELLALQAHVATWSLDHRSQLEPLVNKIGLSHFWVQREWDKQLLELNSKDAMNGHVPISAILAMAGVIVAILSGYKDVIVSNESSASEPNLHYQGVDINHQYSKSLEFEKDFQTYLMHNFGDSLRYYSLLRPFTELKIAEIFAQSGFEKYKDVFSSCNRAFIHSSDNIFWCGECPKCAFVFLALTPFINRDKLEALWHGKNLLLDPGLAQTYKKLLGIEGDKPLECVGEIKESRAAMRLAQEIYPELKKYEFELPEDYDFRSVGPSSMPSEASSILKSAGLLG